MGRVFANGSGDLVSIPGQVIPKTLKMVLDTSLLNTQQYKVRIKGKVEQSGDRNCALPHTSVLQILKKEPSGRPWLRSPILLTVCFQVFFSNTNNLMISSNYFYSLGERRLWIRFYFSSNVPLVLSVLVLEVGGRWPYSRCCVGCCFQDLFNIAHSILVQFPSSFFSIHLVICLTKVMISSH